MEIILHSHHAPVSEHMRQRARRAVEKATQRIPRGDAVVRFEEDGPMRRVEVVLRMPRRRNIVAEGTGRYFGPALTVAVQKLERQIAGLKRRNPPARARRIVLA